MGGGTKKVRQQSAATTTRAKKLSCSIFRLCSRARNYSIDQKEKSPPEEVKNLFEPTTRTARVTPVQQQARRNLEPQPMSQPASFMHHIDGNSHFVPRSNGLYALCDEGGCSHLDRRNICPTLTRRTCLSTCSSILPRLG